MTRPWKSHTHGLSNHNQGSRANIYVMWTQLVHVSLQTIYIDGKIREREKKKKKKKKCHQLGKLK